jgi:hypothetical protein
MDQPMRKLMMSCISQTEWLAYLLARDCLDPIPLMVGWNFWSKIRELSKIEKAAVDGEKTDIGFQPKAP